MKVLEKEIVERIERLENALRPFAKVADAYDADGLDECRPDWVKRGIKKLDLGVELYSGRGGKELITLGNILEARAALLGTEMPYLPEVDPFIVEVMALYAASIPNIGWGEMSEERRNHIIENFRALKK